MLDDVTKKRFEEALASGTLKELCDVMVSEGASQIAIYDSFSSFWLYLSDKNRDRDSDTLGGVLDHIVGWCRPGAGWFDHSLTNEEIYAHQSGLTEEQVHELSALVLRNAPNEVFCGVHREPNGELTVKTALIRAGTFQAGRTYTCRRLATEWQIEERKS